MSTTEDKYMLRIFGKRMKLLTAVGLSSWVVWVGGLAVYGPDAITTLAAVAGALYIVGTLADLKSTETALEMGALEMNLTLPAKPDKDELYSRGHAIADSVSLVIGMVIPPVGVAVGIDRLKLALENTRKIKEFKKD